MQNWLGRTWIAYFAALASIGVATGIRFALHDVLGEHLIFSVYYLAVTVAAWAGGVRPALVTAILSSIIANYLFSAPRWSLWINNAEEFFALVLFLSVSTVIGVLSEISLRAMAKARLAEQQKDDFLAILAHELRNPLAVIHYTNLDGQGSRRLAQHGKTKIIDQQVHQLNQMINDLLDISHVARGKFRLNCELIDLADVVPGAIEKVRRTIDARGQEFTVERESAELPLYADPLRMEQVIVNLLANAAKYTPRGGKVHLRIAREQDSVVICVRDNGQGIPREMLSRVFDLYFQIEQSLERSGTGLGIGLALVRTLVDLHGGTISALSNGPGEGSEFIVRLPIYNAELAEGRPLDSNA